MEGKQLSLLVKKCMTCEKQFESHNSERCPHCGSGDWVYGTLDEPVDMAEVYKNFKEEETSKNGRQ